MITAFDNNIKMHFFDYLNRYVNSYWKVQYVEQFEAKTLTMDVLKKELKKVKKDILCGTSTSDSKYHQWITTQRNTILPSEYTISYDYDVKKDPQKYIKYMIYQNIELEKIKGKMYQFCPLRNSCIPHFIHIDNTTIIKLFIEGDKTEYTENITAKRKQLWETYFNIDVIGKIKIKDYQFDYAFMTDGYNASLRFIHIDELVKQINSQDMKRKGRKAMKGLTKEEKDKIRKEKKSKEDEKVKAKSKIADDNAPKKKSPKPKEFEYFDDVDIDIIKQKKYVVVDPGKRDLLSMMDTNGNTLKYSNSRRVKETKRLKYQRLLQNVKNTLGISAIETELSDCNSKSCSLDVYQTYLAMKTKANKEVLPLYENIAFRQYKWYAFILRKRCEDNMLNLIEAKYGKDVNIIYGDWSQGKQMSNFMSTPNLGIKRKLTERFNVYNIDEYKTSKLNYKTEEKCSNIKLPDKTGTLRKIHSVLTYKMENGSIGCINRDRNACINMLKIVSHHIKTGERVPSFRRTIKDSNPKNPHLLVSVKSKCQMESSSSECMESKANNLAIICE